MLLEVVLTVFWTHRLHSKWCGKELHIIVQPAQADFASGIYYLKDSRQTLKQRGCGTLGKDSQRMITTVWRFITNSMKVQKHISKSLKIEPIRKGPTLNERRHHPLRYRQLNQHNRNHSLPHKVLPIFFTERIGGIETGAMACVPTAGDRTIRAGAIWYHPTFHRSSTRFLLGKYAPFFWDFHWLCTAETKNFKNPRLGVGKTRYACRRPTGGSQHQTLHNASGQGKVFAKLDCSLF